MGTKDDGADDAAWIRRQLEARRQEMVARAHRKLGKWLKTRVSAVSVVNDTSIRVLNSVPRFRHLSEEAFWNEIRVILDHVVIDEARKHRRVQRREGPFEAAVNLPSEGTSVSRAVARRQDAPAVLKTARAVLSEGQLLAFTLRMEGRGFDEIAAALGVTEAAARRKCERAVSAVSASLSGRRPA